MVVQLHPDIEGWRPSWAQMIDIVERFCHENESADELRWLRSHPVDWLMVARYMRVRTEEKMARTRKGLSEIPRLQGDTGRPTFEYLKAKSDADSLNRRRLRWMGKLNEQIAEAKYIVGFEKIPNDLQADLVERLLMLRMALQSNFFDGDNVLGMVEGLLHTYTGGTFDPDAYRPRAH